MLTIIYLTLVVCFLCNKLNSKITMKYSSFTLYLSLILLIKFNTLLGQDIPDKLSILNTTISITPDGKTEIQKKVASLHRNQEAFQKFVDKCNIYFPIIEPILAEYGLPDEIKYLALQESTLEPEAISSSKAVGFWQFKIETAWETGLRVDANPGTPNVVIDERMHIIESTRGAAKYLSNNRKHLNNSWVYALISYNTGLKGCQLWYQKNKGFHPNIPVVVNKDMHHYLKHFIANYLAFYPYVKKTAPKVRLVPYYTNNKTLDGIAFASNTSKEDIHYYNKWMRAHKKIPTDKPYTVLIPALNNSQEKDLMALVSSTSIKHTKRGVRAGLSTFHNKSINETYPFIVKNQPSQKNNVDGLKVKTMGIEDANVFIKVNGLNAIKAKDGDTFSSLAKRAGISKWKFRRLNDLKRNDKIDTGDFYYLEKRPETIMIGGYYKPERGETYKSIAKKFGISQKGLRKINGVKRSDEEMNGQLFFQ